MAGIKLVNSDLEVQGSIKVTTTPNNTGSIVTKHTDGTLSIRTPAQIKSDIGANFTAGSGLTLSGTTFSLPVTTSGTGSFVQSVAQNTNGITVTLGTPPNTTYSTGSIAELNTGTVTTGRLWGSNVLNSWLTGKLPAPQTLSLGSTSGNIAISGGNNISLSDLSMGSRNDATERYLNYSFKPYYTFSGHVGYPNSTSFGTGMRLERYSGPTSQLGFDIYSSGQADGIGHGLIYSRVFRGENTEGDWEILASREWSNSQGWLKSADLSGLVPYTGANQTIDFNTQDFTTGGYTNRLPSYFERINLASNSTSAGNFKLLTNVAAAEIANASTQTSDIIITLPITTTTVWQAEIDILRQGYRTTLNLGGYDANNASRFVNVVYGNIDDIIEIKFGRIGTSTVIIIKRSNQTINRLQVNISKFYYHHSNSINLYNDKTKYKIEYINESELIDFTLNGVVTNAQFTRDSYYLDYNNLTNKPTTIAGYGITDAYTKGEVNNGFVNTTGNQSGIAGNKVWTGTQTVNNYATINAQTNTISSVFTNPALKIKAKANPTQQTGSVAITLATSTTDNHGISLAAVRADSSGAAPTFSIRTHLNSAVGVEVLKINNSGQVTIPNLSGSGTRVLGANASGDLTTIAYGTTAGTIAQGNDSRINNGQTAFGWGNHSGLYALVGRSIVAGNGLSGGGTLAANRTITLGTPAAVGLSTTNAVTTSSHTHALDSATTTAINNGQTAFGWGNHASEGYLKTLGTVSEGYDLNNFNGAGAYGISSSIASTILNKPYSGSQTSSVTSIVGGSYGLQLYNINSGGGSLYFRGRASGAGNWGDWNEVWHSGNLRSDTENDARYLQSSDISGLVPYTGATTNVNLGARSITSTGGFLGNATTATRLATARTINGTSFNGSANITTANWGTARNITIGNTTKSVNGSGNYSWSLAEIGLGDYITTETDPIYTASISSQVMLKGHVASNDDLNTYTSTGVFGCATNAVATSLINCPTDSAFELTVKRIGSSMIFQQMQVHSSRKIFVRNFSGSTWNTWASFAHTSEIPTVNNGQLTLSTGTGLSGSATFTADQSTNSTFTVGIASGYVLPTTAQTTSWDNKQNAITGGATTIVSSNLTANRALISNASGKVAVSTVTSTQLGYLSGVTSAIQTQLNGKINSSLIGANNGVASLGSDGKINSNQLPALAITETFPVTSQTQMLALTAQQGDVAVRSDINKTFILRQEPASTIANWEEMLMPASGVQSVAMSVPTGFSISGSPITSTGTLALGYASGYQGFTTAQSTKLAGIATGANNYTLPVATATVRGGVELFSNTVQSVAANAVTTTASRTYGIQLNSAGQAVVNVPWSNTNTTYSAGSGLTLSGTTFSVNYGTAAGTAAQGNHTHTFAQITNKPTTIAGYGITDAYTKSEVDGLMPTNYVNTTGNQSGIAGNKVWTGTQTVNNYATINAQTNTISSVFTNPALKIEAKANPTQQTGTVAITLATSTTDNHGISLAAVRADSSGAAPTFSIRTHLNSAVGVEVLKINNSGQVTISNLSGSGTRVLGANASGGLTTIAYGTASGTIAQGNDSRINNGQTAFGWGNHGSAGYALASRTITAGTGLTGGGSLAGNRTINFDTAWGDNRYLGINNTAKDAETLTGITTSITITGDVNTYYPVVISSTSRKTFPTLVSVWKNLNSPTNSNYEGNHSNGTSSLWLQYETRNTTWDGNGGYHKTHYKSEPYATLVANTNSLGGASGALTIWLRGGGTQYNITVNNPSTNVDVYYTETQVASGATVAPRTTVGNGGIYSTTPYGYGSLIGNASTATTATTLATARTINGTSFDGSANITTARWGTARTITIGNTGKSVNGSGNVAWSLSEIFTAGNNITLSGNTISATDTNTTYSAGNGLTLSGTTFSIPITTSGSGTYVQTVTQTANGLTLTLGTPPNTNTTYAAMTAAEALAGTSTTARSITAKVLADEIARRGGTLYLPLTGGTLSNSGFGGSLTIHRAAANNSMLGFTATSGTKWYIGMDVVTGEFGVVNSTVGVTTSKVKLNGSTGVITGTSLSLSGTTAQYIRGDGSLATFPSIPAGDITGVTAGTGLSGGGTSGTVTLNIAAAYSPNTSTSLGTADLNATTTPGFYHQTSNANATTARNYPSTNAGNLQVYRDAGITQRYNVYNSGATYVRNYYSSSWTAWVRTDPGASVPTSRTITLTGGTGITVSAGAQNLSANRTWTITNSSPNATHTGDVTGATALTIANSAVTHAKYQNIATQRILGRGAAGTGNVQELTLGANLSLSTAGVLSATNTNTVTRLRGTTSGTLVSGDVTLAAGSNVTISQSGNTITIGSTGGGTGFVDLTTNQTINGVKTFVQTIYSQGDVVSYSTSDIRLKENVSEIKNSLEKINYIKGYEYDWKEEAEFEGPDVGVIAQEVEKILPEAVVTRENGHKAVRYEKLIPVLINAINELSKKVEDLKNGISK